MGSLLRVGSAYKSMGSFHGESVEVLIRAACQPGWVPPAVPEAVAAALQKARPAAASARGQFGHALGASQFLLDPGWTFVNHGAFGAPCIVALSAASAWREYAERQPLRFIDRELFPHLVESTRRTALWLGACPSSLALVPNATTGLNCVIASIAGGLAEGDEVVILDVGYGSCATMLRRACERGGAVPVVVDVLPALAELFSSGSPVTADAVGCAVLERVERALTPRTRLAIFDDITSNTALKLPSRALAELCRARGVLSLVDCAHSACSPHGAGGALASADFVVGNLHKWACAPRGSAFLYARPEHQQRLEPPVLSHGYGGGFLSNFIWSGAADYSPLLALPHLLTGFWGDDGGQGGGVVAGGVDAGVLYQQLLLAEACAHLRREWGTRALVEPRDSGAHMALVELPMAHTEGITSKDVQDFLHFAHKVECPVKTVNGRLYCRISAGLYNEIADYERLGEAVLDFQTRRST